MNQDQINQEEWNNRDNWSFLAYHSAKDSRTIVPKRFGWGWTINFRNKTFARFFMGTLLTVAVVGMIVSLTLLVIFPRK